MPEFQRREAGFGFEEFAKGLEVLKAKFIGNFANRKIGGGELFFGEFDQLTMQVLPGVLAGQGFGQATEVTGRDI